jgi:hypothetical protein
MSHDPARPTLEPPTCVPASRPDNPDLLPECAAEDSADPEPSCVPREARGREIARDDDEHMHAYEVCIPESRYVMPARLRVDPGRLIIERSGERPARGSALETIAYLFGAEKPSRVPDLPNGKPAPPAGLELLARPNAFVCWNDNELNCLAIYVQGPPALPRLLAGIAKWLPSDGTCVAIQVDYGWRAPCPENNSIQPVTQR